MADTLVGGAQVLFSMVLIYKMIHSQVDLTIGAFMSVYDCVWFLFQEP